MKTEVATKANDIPNYSCSSCRRIYLPFDSRHMDCPGGCGYSAEEVIPDMPKTVLLRALDDFGKDFAYPVSASEIYTAAIIKALKSADKRLGTVQIECAAELLDFAHQESRRQGFANGYRDHMEDFIAVTMAEAAELANEFAPELAKVFCKKT